MHYLYFGPLVSLTKSRERSLIQDIALHIPVLGHAFSFRTFNCSVVVNLVIDMNKARVYKYYNKIENGSCCPDLVVGWHFC